MSIKKNKKIFLKIFSISFFLFLFFFIFLHKSYAATCGGIGGNSCTTRWSSNCENLGNTSDCSPCWRCHVVSAPPPAPAEVERVVSVAVIIKFVDYRCDDYIDSGYRDFK